MIARNFMLADRVDPGPRGKVFIHGGTLTTIDAVEFPHVQSQISVFATIEFEENDEAGTDHRFNLRVTDSAGKQVSPDMGDTFRVPPADNQVLTPGINFSLGIEGAQFPEPGIYWFTLWIDDQEVARAPLAVGSFEVVTESPEEAD